MNEDRLRHLEEKIDFLYKILLDKRIYDVGYPYGFKHLREYIDTIGSTFHIQAIKQTKIEERLFAYLEEKFIVLKKEKEKLKTKFENENFPEEDKDLILKRLENKEKAFEKWKLRYENKDLLFKKIKKLDKLLYEFEIYKRFIEKVGAHGSPIAGEIKTKLEGILREFDFQQSEFIQFLENSELNVLLKKLNKSLKNNLDIN